MPLKEVRAAGLDSQELATDLLHRNRVADPHAGLWEAADIQWWWRKPRQSDAVEKLFWLDDDGPVAGVVLTSWPHHWQCDPIIVPHANAPDPVLVWSKAMELAASHAPDGFEIPVNDDDRVFQELARKSGFVAGDRDSTAWMAAADRPALVDPAAGFVLVDRAQRQDAPHPMRHRNGEAIAERLAQCSLYDPALDLAVETTDGTEAGYSLYWYDPVTKVGLVEPVRVEDAFQRRGLASAMLTAGIERLVERGAERIKVSYESEAAAAVYHRAGFQAASSTTWYRKETA